jgi:flagellum-specific peptidoglycan hydrolase FlgJ
LAPVYATDPHYVDRVSQIVQRYDLDAWDDLVARRVAKHAL